MNKWPNDECWKAGHEGQIELQGRKVTLSVVDCGKLKVKSGRLVLCDPFAAMRHGGNPYFQIPVGEYSVRVTLADISEAQDGSHIREAFGSLILDESKEEVCRKVLQPSSEGGCVDPDQESGNFNGYGVDAGTACFVDDQAVVEGMPKDAEVNWFEELFDTGVPNSWFDLMDDSEHIRDGIANVILPESNDGSNLILFHSGWGDGVYPVLGGYDVDDNLIAVHTDLFVLAPEE